MSEDDLRQEIESTRQRLGETVDELAAKADVKARAQAKAAETTAQARDRAVEATAQARDRVTETTAQARDRVAGTTAQARDRAAKVTAQARDRAVEVSGRVSRSEAVRRRWPVAVAAAVVIAGTVVIWRWKRA
jgi:Protein of unknown function (DUF3618)